MFSKRVFLFTSQTITMYHEYIIKAQVTHVDRPFFTLFILQGQRTKQIVPDAAKCQRFIFIFVASLQREPALDVHPLSVVLTRANTFSLQNQLESLLFQHKLMTCHQTA